MKKTLLTAAILLAVASTANAVFVPLQTPTSTLNYLITAPLTYNYTGATAASKYSSWVNNFGGQVSMSYPIVRFDASCPAMASGLGYKLKGINVYAHRSYGSQNQSVGTISVSHNTPISPLIAIAPLTTLPSSLYSVTQYKSWPKFTVLSDTTTTTNSKVFTIMPYFGNNNSNGASLGVRVIAECEYLDGSTSIASISSFSSGLNV